jgi:hypothetical protein
MSAYEEFLAEKEQIDYLVQQDYQIKGVIENLSGAFVTFELKNQNEAGTRSRVQLIQITNADARKYFSSLIIQQNKQCK